MKRLLLGCVYVLLASAHPARSASPDSDHLAIALGSVIAGEEFCGLAYDQGAIEAFIEKNVPASDMDFAESLDTMVGGSKYEQEKMGQSEKTAHCAQIRRVAKSYGLIR